MVLGSLFSGIGGFDLGFERAGFRTAWQVEIDPFCRRILGRHWPTVPKYDDVRDVDSALSHVDVITAGFPCQDLSIAGRRAGLRGARSGLFFELTRILKFLRPTWIVIENVDGFLSSHDGADFSVALRELEDVGYVGCWRVLDSRWFGVPQRRNRVFLVGHLGGLPERATPVLFESARSGWDSPPRAEAGSDVAACLRSRTHGPGIQPPGRGGEDDLNLVVGPLAAVTTEAVVEPKTIRISCCYTRPRTPMPRQSHNRPSSTALTLPTAFSASILHRSPAHTIEATHNKVPHATRCQRVRIHRRFSTGSCQKQLTAKKRT